jgi:hypothetical protein
MPCLTDGLPINPQVEIVEPQESNGAIPVNIQDQTSPPIDALFAQQVGAGFSLAVDTVASGITAASLVYTFTAVGGHGIAPGDEILLLDVVGNRSFFCVVISVAVNDITVDRPIDFLFPVASTLGRIVTTNMAVNGNVTPQIFSLRAGEIPIDGVRFIMTGTNNIAMDYSKFMGRSPLAKGIVFRILNDFQKTIFCFKTDAEIAQFCYDLKYLDKAPAGEYGVAARISFGGADKHGVVLRISGTDVLQWVVQDDLSSLLSLNISAQGHEVTD